MVSVGTCPGSRTAIIRLRRSLLKRGTLTKSPVSTIRSGPETVHHINCLAQRHHREAAVIVKITAFDSPEASVKRESGISIYTSFRSFASKIVPSTAKARAPATPTAGRTGFRVVCEHANVVPNAHLIKRVIGRWPEF